MANTIFVRILRLSQHQRLRQAQYCTNHNNPQKPPTIAAMPALGWLSLDVGLALAFGVAVGTLIVAMVAA